jgi:hypothetical protein
MNQTFEQRIQSIEAQLKEIRKELEEGLAQYKDWKLEEEFREMLKRG